MGFFRRRKDGRASVLAFCQTLCLCATWAQIVKALPQDATDNNTSIALTTASFDLLPITGLIPSASITSPTRLIPSQTRSFGLIPSQRPTSDPLPPIPTDPEPAGSGLLPSTSLKPIDHDPPPPTLSSTTLISQIIPSGLIPSATITQNLPSSESSTALTPSLTLSTATDPIHSSQTSTGVFNSSTHASRSMASTDEPLRPIPAPTGLPDGDPNGHHEISEPNFTATVPCRRCSPVIELSRTGFYDWPSTPIADHEPTPPPPPKATVTAGTSQVIISKESTGGNWVIGGSTTISSGQTAVVGRTTVAPGQTVIVDNTPIVIQTSSDRTDVVIGSSTVAITQPAQITPPPALAPVVVGGQTLTADPQSQYTVSGQILAPGGPAITIDGTTLSLLPSATAIVVNGVTTTLIIPNAAIITTTVAPLITLFSDNQVFTANSAGQYVLAPGTTLTPGGPPVTVSNTVISLDPRGTAVVVQGSTRSLAPQTTIITITRTGNWGGDVTSSPRWSNALPKGTLGSLNAGVGLETTCLGSVLALALVWLGIWL